MKSYAWFSALHRGFREQAWKDAGTSLEPELDWFTDLKAEEAGYTRRVH